MKKYIAPEVSLIKELANDFCDGVIDTSTVTGSDLNGYTQLEGAEEMED